MPTTNRIASFDGIYDTEISVLLLNHMDNPDLHNICELANTIYYNLLYRTVNRKFQSCEHYGFIYSTYVGLDGKRNLAKVYLLLMLYYVKIMYSSIDSKIH